MDALLKKQLEIAATKVRMGSVRKGGTRQPRLDTPADPFPSLTH